MHRPHTRERWRRTTGRCAGTMDSCTATTDHRPSTKDLRSGMTSRCPGQGPISRCDETGRPRPSSVSREWICSGSLDKKLQVLYPAKYFLPWVTGGSDERLSDEASDLQGLRSLGDVGRSRDRSIVGVALAGAQDRGHTPDPHGAIRGWPLDPRLDRRWGN